MWGSLVNDARGQGATSPGVTSPWGDFNRPFQGFRRHPGWGVVTAKIPANVWEIVQLSNLVTQLLYNGV